MMQTEREYATALFTLTAEENSTEAYVDCMKTIRDILRKNEEYVEFLSSPAVSVEERAASIDEAFGEGFPEYALSFLKVLCENGRMKSVFGCIDEFIALAMSVSDRTNAVIYSAVELSESQKKAVVAKLEKITKKQVEAQYIIDKTLIGGMKIEVEGKTFDGSVRHRLQEVKDVIMG